MPFRSHAPCQKFKFINQYMLCLLTHYILISSLVSAVVVGCTSLRCRVHTISLFWLASASSFFFVSPNTSHCIRIALLSVFFLFFFSSLFFYPLFFFFFLLLLSALSITFHIFSISYIHFCFVFRQKHYLLSHAFLFSLDQFFFRTLFSYIFSLSSVIYFRRFSSLFLFHVSHYF